MQKAVRYQRLLHLLSCSLGSLPLLVSSILPSLANNLTPPTVPDNLKAPEGEVLLLKSSAKGVQIYQCQSKVGNPSQFEWTLKAPEAILYNDRGKRIGKHYAGPTWEANDGSMVVGQVKERANSPDKRAVPWLLLTAKSHQGNGVFSRVTSIQRVDTVAGQAPNNGCDQSHNGAQVRINYRANYYFYGATSTNQ
ncbi:MAG TPA: DUF3455 domain-containing protein [Waterburya sp.]|jgi:hypothetical protein